MYAWYLNTFYGTLYAEIPNTLISGFENLKF